MLCGVRPCRYAMMSATKWSIGIGTTGKEIEVGPESAMRSGSMGARWPRGSYGGVFNQRLRATRFPSAGREGWSKASPTKGEKRGEGMVKVKMQKYQGGATRKNWRQDILWVESQWGFKAVALCFGNPIWRNSCMEAHSMHSFRSFNLTAHVVDLVMTPATPDTAFSGIEVYPI